MAELLSKPLKFPEPPPCFLLPDKEKEIFHPMQNGVRGGVIFRAGLQAAVKMCKSCPFMEECLRDGREYSQTEQGAECVFVQGGRFFKRGEEIEVFLPEWGDSETYHADRSLSFSDLTAMTGMTKHALHSVVEHNPSLFSPSIEDPNKGMCIQESVFRKVIDQLHVKNKNYVTVNRLAEKYNLPYKVIMQIAKRKGIKYRRASMLDKLWYYYTQERSKGKVWPVMYLIERKIVKEIEKIG